VFTKHTNRTIHDYVGVSKININNSKIARLLRFVVLSENTNMIVGNEMIA
jgi:hypothetical protein